VIGIATVEHRPHHVLRNGSIATGVCSF
jgi:hypothetical protein